MIRESRIITSIMRGKLLCLVACLALAGALMFPGNSFGAWALDSSFNPAVNCNPDAPPQDCVHTVVQQADGKVLVGGNIDAPESWLSRFNSNGTADSTFNGNVSGLGLDGSVDEIVIQTNGKIIIGGHFTTPRKGVARLNTDGTIDSSLNAQLDNCLDTALGDSGGSSVTALALQADGNLLVGGNFKNVGPGTCPAIPTAPPYTFTTTNLHPFFVRLLTAGTGTGALDTSFTPNVSSTVTQIIPLDTGTFVSNKKILAAGYYYKMHCYYCGMASYPTTTINPGTGAPACMDLPDNPNTYVDYGQCMSYNATTQIRYVSLISMTDGSRDSSFQSQRTDGDDKVFAIARQSDGKVLVAGGVNYFNQCSTTTSALCITDSDCPLYPSETCSVPIPITDLPWLQRMNTDGSIDSTYNPNANNTVNALGILSSDNLITGGSFTMMGGSVRNNVARLDSSGAVDLTFDPNANGPIQTIYSTPTGTQIYIGGSFTSVGGTARNSVARLFDDGKTATSTSIISPTVTYGTSGSVTVTVSASSGTPNGNVGLSIDGGPTTTRSLNSGSYVFSNLTLPAGDHTLYATYAGTSTYAASSATGTLPVTQAILTVNANSVSRPYLASNPTFSASYATFVNGDTISVVSGSPVLTTPAVVSSPIGTYPINIVSISGLSAANYSFAQGSDGILTVTPASTTTSVSSNSTPTVYGNPVTFTATVTGTGAAGSVTFNDGGTFMGTGTLAGGTATYTAALLSAGTHTITAVYSGDSNFAGSTSTNFIQTINKLPTTASIASNTTSTAYGSSVTFTATVTSGATGTVTFMDGAATLGTGLLSGGSPNTATYMTSALGVSGNPHLVTATYNGDANHAASPQSSPVSVTITPAATTVTVSSDLPTTTYGNNVIFTATVNSGATGTIEFKDNGSTIGEGTVSGGIATFSTSTLAVGSHPITATYNGDANFAGSTSNPSYTQTINKATSTTSIASDTNPSAYGSPVTFTATVTSGATGTVTFMDGAATLGTGLLSGGSPNTATYMTSALSVSGSPHSITAVYSGDANYTTSTTSSLDQTITLAATVTGVYSNSSSTTYGSLVTFTATISTSATGTTTGTVTFKDNGTQIGVGTVSGGIATFGTSTLTVGSHPITATYNGDTNFAASTSNPAYTQTINKAASSTTIGSNPNPSIYGSTVTFTATVTSAGGTPTGTVSFNDSVSGNIGTGTLSGTQATLPTGLLSAGTHTITATYEGDTNFVTSTSSNVIQVVNKLGTSTSIASNASSTTYGSPVTFTATVTSGATGTVTFTDSVNGTLGTVTLSGGVATLTTNVLNVGVHNITASYGGDANHNASSSPLPSLVQINRADTLTGITSNIQSAAIGQNITFTATVGSSGGTPTGTVQFYDSQSGALGSPATLSSGSASLIIGLSTLGTHTISATYSGDANFNLSSTTTPQPIVVVANTTTTSIALTGGTSPSTYGTLLTFQASVTSGGTGTPGGTVNFNDNGGTTIGSGILNNSGIATFSTSTLGGGSHSITAVYIGDGINFGGSTSSTAVPLTVNQASQTITFGALATQTYGNAPFTLGATASSNLTVSYTSSNTSVATVSGNIVTIVGAGTTTITASQTGDSNYAAAVSVPQSLIVNQASQTITFGALAAQTYGNGTFTLNATASSGFTVSYTSSNPSVASISGNVVTLVSAGSTTITASQAGNSNYAAAASVQQLLTVNKATLTVTADNQNKAFNAINPTLTWTYSGFVNSETASVLSGSPSLSTSATTTSPTGSYPITVSIGTLQASNYTFNLVDGTLTIGLLPQTITFGALPAKAYGDADFSPGAASDSGLPVSYASSNPAVATVVGNNIHIVGAGTTTITASQAGNSNYNAANPVLQSLTVNKANLMVTADDMSRAFNAPNPSFTWTYSGFVNGDTAAVLSGSPALTTTATSVSQPGSYPITVAVGTLSSANYTFGFTNGTLTVSLIADGKFDGGTGAVNATDALKALRIAAGIDTPSVDDLEHGDVAPLVNGQRKPDGKIDLSDVVAILRKAVGLPSW